MGTHINLLLLLLHHWLLIVLKVLVVLLHPVQTLFDRQVALALIPTASLLLPPPIERAQADARAAHNARCDGRHLGEDGTSEPGGTAGVFGGCLFIAFTFTAEGLLAPRHRKAHHTLPQHASAGTPFRSLSLRDERTHLPRP